MDQKIGQITDDLINTAKGFLRSFGAVCPGLFVVSGNDVTNIAINEDTVRDRSLMSDLLKHVTDISTKALFLIMESNESLLCFLFTPENSYLRKIDFIKGEKTTIADFGWKEDTTKSPMFLNPFDCRELQEP